MPKTGSAPEYLLIIQEIRNEQRFFLAPLFRHSVGFDRFNDLFESALRNEAGSTYPPYNVEKHGDDEYRIVIAAAGFQEEDLTCRSSAAC